MLRYMLLPLLALTASAYVLERAPCKGAGFFAPVDKTPAYYGCYPNKDGGFTMKILTCPAGQVFSLEVRHCVVPALRVRAASDGEEIENPTKPPTTKKPDIENPTVPTLSTAKPDGSTENMAETTVETTVEKEPSTEPTSEPSEPTVTPTEPTPSKKPTDEPTESTESSKTTEKAPSTAPSSEPSEPTVTPTEPTPSKKPTDKPSEPTISTEPSETPTEKPFTCPTKGFFASREGCNKFVYCMSSSPKSDPVQLTCPPGQEFNPSILFCDQSFKCNAESESESKVAAALSEFDCIMEGVFPDAEDKTKYFICKWSENAQSFQYEHKSCGKSEVFHRLTGKCGRHLQLPKTLLNLGH